MLLRSALTFFWLLFLFFSMPAFAQTPQHQKDDSGDIEIIDQSELAQAALTDLLRNAVSNPKQSSSLIYNYYFKAQGNPPDKLRILALEMMDNPVSFGLRPGSDPSVILTVLARFAK